MDPDANLQELRRTVQRILGRGNARPADAERLADLVDALDGWLSRGGFLPAEWQKGR